ncbi:MAG: Cof-type HAD-IIB family hydrolase [Candidatus Borkfalkiaceae bacterium]|nr:Cof-type HAD-IIB family hydrolase [Clostridia bacterium]MDY6222864.1 Cof-type HAD-IIB family hydrolase [Christensenellaceae bacterium]
MNNALKYRLIACDLDGTLLKDDKTVNAYTLKQIQRFIAAGGKFCICTGRMLPSVEKIARDLHVTGLATSYAGALVSDLQTGKILYENSLTAKEAAEIAATVERDGVHLQYYTGSVYYANRNDESLKKYEKSCRVNAVPVLNRPLSAQILERGEKVNKLLMIIEDPARHEELLQKYRAIFGERFWVTRSTSRYIEILSKSCNKGTALVFMANYYGVPVEQTIAAGDQLNDEEMLTAAGLGLCVKNGNEELKKRVPVFNATNNDDAVGKIIAQYVFGEQSEEKDE